jgi:hypothetical protein
VGGEDDAEAARVSLVGSSVTSGESFVWVETVAVVTESVSC